MLVRLQVDKQHYRFADYMSRPRWDSLWYQVKEILDSEPRSVLEIGPGPGFLKAVLNVMDIPIKTLDIDPALSPDYVGTIGQSEFHDGEFDVVCAFQVLEHMPYEEALAAFERMVSVARKRILVSLPDIRKVYRVMVQIPGFGEKNIFVPKPNLVPKLHKFDGQHYWELNKRDFPVARIARDFSRYATLSKCYRIPENPYHRMFVFAK